MKKIPLILLPGLLCDAAVWSHQAENLSSIADIIIPDLNHASSPQAMVLSALEHAPAQFALAGHSMGGWVALEIMKHAPKRVLGLALLNTTALPDTKEKYDIRELMIEMAESGDSRTIINRLLPIFVDNKAVEDDVKAMLERNMAALIPQEYAMIQRGGCTAVLENIACPTLIVHSDHDAVFHIDDSELLANKIKHATMAVIKNCGHMSPMESPEEVTLLMYEWLMSIGKH